MEHVSIQIPASLFASLFAEYGEDTSEVIHSCLENLVPNTSVRESVDSQPFRYPRPGPGTITGKIWDVADGILDHTGAASREAVVTECVRQGIKFNTANTQYSYWKKSRDLSKPRD